MPKRQENLIPFDERTESERRQIAQKGGQASGRARRKKADFRRAALAILQLEMPAAMLPSILTDSGLEPTLENALIFSAIYEGIKNGDINAVMRLREITGQHRTLADIQEQKARIDRLKAETERIQADADRKSGVALQEEAGAQVAAIADMINSPAADRALQEFLGHHEEANDEQSDTVCTSEPEAE